MAQQPITRRKFLTTGSALGATALLGGKALRSAPRLLSRSSSPIQIQYWAAFVNSQSQNYFTKYYIDDWNNTHPDIQVQLVIKDINTLTQATNTALDAGQGPDIVTSDGSSQVIPYAQAHQILPLTSYANKYGWHKLILPWAFGASTWKGQLWSLPNPYETMVDYYNPETFSKHGWHAPANRSELEELFKEAKGRGIQPIIAGNADFKAADEWFVTMFLNHYAGPDALYQALSGKLRWTDPVFVDAIDLLNRYFQAGYIGNGSSVDNYFTTHFPQCYTAIANGKAAMYWSGTWEIGSLPPYFGKAAGNKATWTWSPIPAMRSGIPPVLYELSIGGATSINAHAKRPDAVAEYMSWSFANTRAAAVGLKEFGQELPPVHFTSADFPAGTNPNDVRIYEELQKYSAEGLAGYTTWTFWPPKSDTYIINQFEYVLTKSITPKQYCAGLESVFRKEFEQGLVPPLFVPKSY